jgi:hypothetical protein
MLVGLAVIIGKDLSEFIEERYQPYPFWHVAASPFLGDT